MTAVTPLRPGAWRRRWLRAVFEFGQMTDVAIRPLLAMRVIALGRWSLWPSDGPARYLIFQTDWSGSDQNYIPDFGRIMPVQWQTIWGVTEGFGGSLPTTGLLRWVQRVDRGPGHLRTDYAPGATTDLIVRALRLWSRLSGALAESVETPAGPAAARLLDRLLIDDPAAPASSSRPPGRPPGRAPDPPTGQVTIVSPVAPGRAAQLTALLAGLGDGPFAGRLPPTHFARFVVIELDPGPPENGRRPHLLFSARFDGPADAYLRALAAAPVAQTIFGHCALPDGVDAADATRLGDHLCARRTRLRDAYTVNAVPAGTSVGRVNAALALREQVRTWLAGERFGPQGIVDAAADPESLVHDLRQLPAVGRILEEL